MPTAAKNATSPARVEANRRNAARSTGPRTEEGKARSRANAVKHGLAGAGVALPDEDAAAVAGLFLELQEELAPATRVGAELVHDVALLTVRKRRARSAQAAWLRARVRRAGAEYDRMRAEHADRLLDAIEAHPRPYRRELLALPEGVDRLIGALEELLGDLLGAAPFWSQAHHQRLDALFGYRPADLPRSRPTRFSKAVLGDFDAIGEAELAAIPEGRSRLGWAAERLVEAVDAEVDRLQAHRGTLDHAAIAQDRIDAVEAARFDTGRDAELARRYELAAARELSRTLRDLPLAEALGAADRPDEPRSEAQSDPMPAPTETPNPDLNPLPSNDIPAPLASFGENAAAAVVAAELAPTAAPAAPGAAPRPVPTVASTPPQAPHGG